MSHRHIRRLQESFTAIERCRKPVLCAVQGACFGGGVDMAVACDVRVCSSDASFCVKEVDLAIVADIGTLQRLPKIVGHGVATEMALTARVVGAEEARLIGLVSEVAPSPSALETRAMRWLPSSPPNRPSRRRAPRRSCYTPGTTPSGRDWNTSRR